MKTITKNTKRVLSLFIALALLLGSMITFGGNAGVNITASASAETATIITWDGTIASSFSDTTHGGTSWDDAIIISTPAELAFLAMGAGGTAASDNLSNATTGVYYKVADNLIFDMNGMSGITLSSTLSDVESNSSLTGKNWNSLGDYSHSYKFMGYFDGNGLIVYNLYGTRNFMGLFPQVDGGAVIKNVTIKNSKLISANGGGVGGIFGGHQNYVETTVTIDNCAVVNCYLEVQNTNGKVGLIGGSKNWRSVNISNCLTQNNTVITADGTTASYGGFIGNSSGGGSIPISNSIAIGNSPYCVSGTLATTPVYTNVYTDTENSNWSGSGITVGVSTGADALSTMGLSSAYWLATSSYPELKVAHKFTSVNNGDGTHTATCTCCDPAVEGLAEDHYYDLNNVVDGVATCACGASITFTAKIWDGTADSNWDGHGTEEDPYIIRTPEQLYAMVRSQGYYTDENGADIPLYFKVADGIDTFYLNDTINYNTAEKFAGAIGTMTNWSKDLVTDLTCSDSSCPAWKANNGSGELHYGGYIYTFLGHFDGNGVTITGLYSKTDACNTATSFYPGTGFFPGMSDNASIANVTFDISYIENKGGNAAVVTSSFGTTSNNNYYYGSAARCTSFTTRYAEKNNIDIVGASVTLSNVVVKRAYLTTTYKSQWSVNQNAAGLISAQFSADSVDMSNCLFDARESVMEVNGTETPLFAGMYASPSYINNGNSLYNCVTLSNDNIDNIASNYEIQYNISTNCYAQGTGTTEHGTIWTNDISVAGMPLLDWATWDEDTITPSASSDGFIFKDYKYYKNNFKNAEFYGGNPMGSYSDGNSDDGLFLKFNTLLGSGTESDPYLISDADTLFQIIAAGGMHRGNPQHFKLTNDIDIGGSQWVNYKTSDDINSEFNITYYDYRAFKGVLDGDGYAITGLYTATADATAGFIPTLDGGTVKNLHFRNCYAYSSASGASVGVIAGQVTGDGSIQNCSISDSVTEVIDGSGAATDCINFVTDPVPVTAETDGDIYYGIVGKNAQLKSRGEKLPCVDINADGKGDEYTTDDLTALRQKLLRNADYNLVMGDADKNKTTNIRDLTFVKRMMVGDEFDANDGFWNAVKGGAISIYFSDNDDYDTARKIELFLETQVPGLDVQKFGTSAVTIAGHADDNKTLPTANAIIISSNDTSADWSINYDSANALLKISGKNYTAAYEAAEYFAANSNASTGALVKDYTGIQDTNKSPITVNGSTYYYSWADEFNTAVNDSVNYDTWLIRDKGGDDEVETNTGESATSYATYDDLKLGSDEMLTVLNQVKDGKLYMHRGVSGFSEWNTAFGSSLSSYTSNTRDDDGNKVQFDSNDMASSGILNTKNSMIYKNGYVEFKVTAPNDKYAFPALWLYSTPGYSNRDISLSMYSKVLPLNSRYDNSSNNFVSTSVESYKYEVPTFFYEVDIMEIINQGQVSGVTQTTIHKWYNNARSTDGSTAFSIYDLDWDSVRNGTNQFSNILATVTGTKGSYSLSSSSKLSLHSDISSGSVFASSTYQGGASMQYSVGSSSTTAELVYGFLWEEGNMTLYIMNADKSSTLATIVINDNLVNGDGTYYGYDGYTGTTDSEQYAHILIDNHMFPYKTNSAWDKFWGTADGDFTTEKITNDGVLEVDYVRVYQLDNAKDIVTSDTEAFNTNNRLGK